MSTSRCWKLSNPDSIYLRSHLKFILILEKQLDPSSEVIVRSISQSLNRILVKPRQPSGRTPATSQHRSLRKHLVAWIQQAHRDTWRFRPSLGQKQVLRQEKCLTYNVRPPKTIAFSWGSHNSNVTMVYGIYNELVTGANLNQQTYRTGASHQLEGIHGRGPTVPEIMGFCSVHNVKALRKLQKRNHRTMVDIQRL